MTREAQLIGKRAWGVLPKSRGHLVVVFQRNGPMMAVDAGTDPKLVPLVLFRAAIGTGGFWRICGMLIDEALNRAAVTMGIFKRADR